MSQRSLWNILMMLIQNPSVRPKDPVKRARVRAWIKQLDEGLHAAVGTISGTVAFRHQMIAGRTERRGYRFY